MNKGRQEYLDLSEQAAALLPDITGRDPDERVFKGLKYRTYHNVALLQWCMATGINKHITFHCLSQNKVADLVPLFYSGYNLTLWGRVFLGAPYKIWILIAIFGS